MYPKKRLQSLTPIFFPFYLHLSRRKKFSANTAVNVLRHKGSESISLVDILGEHFRQEKQLQQRTLSQERLVHLRKNT